MLGAQPLSGSSRVAAPTPFDAKRSSRALGRQTVDDAKSCRHSAMLTALSKGPVRLARNAKRVQFDEN
jgi:uncharacterized heparinase superfamily protein